ncbi:MAG: hypothetical protein JRI43_06900, partial [Deltaproteobacteria bacterium]|nr:hypothetical protein [Deltaproteobacteria bacterium]
EILRNQLYDAMHRGSSIEADLVILDEAHYLSDPDRGVVWEEVLIYLPARVKLLLLSATVSNADEVCAWLKKNRGTQTHVVRSNERPVSLDMLFLFPDGLIAPLSGMKGLTSRVKKYMDSRMVRGRRRGSGKLRFGEIISCLRKFDLLPAIFFLKSRSECDRAILACFPPERTPRQKESMKRDAASFLREYPHLKGHRQMSALLNSRVASHHAGQLPYWKILIERMMNKGYLDAIFSTSTVAAGVNFPARTVVLVQSDRFNGHEFADLTATDLHQMIGRAGRRGKDNIGFALVVPGIHQDPHLIQELRDSPSEPLISRIRINFSMTLNLLLSHTPMEVKDLLDHSFAAFQQRGGGSVIQERWEEMLKALGRMLPESRCDRKDPYEQLYNVRKRAELRKEAKRVSGVARDERVLNAFKPYLEYGRLFLHKGKGVYVLFHTHTDQGRSVCAAHNIRKPVRMKKGKIRLRRIPLDKIRVLYDYRIDIPSEYSMEELQEIFDSIDINSLEFLDISVERTEAGAKGQKGVKARLKELPCEDCNHLEDCHKGKNRELDRLMREFGSFANRMAGLGEGLWISFKRHIRFLRETNFVDKADQLTPDGIWASKLRLDQPLLIAEAIRRGGFRDLSPEVMAGCIAPFVWDRDQEVEIKAGGLPDLQVIEEAFSRLVVSMEGVRDLKAKRGFENPSIQFWPVVALFMWAKGIPWDDLLFHIPVGEGDMASMIVRTADHLRQVVNLKETHPELAEVAGTAIGLI